VDRYQTYLGGLYQKIAQVRETPLSDLEAKGVIVDAFRRDILPIRFFKPVSDTYFAPTSDMVDVQPRSLWGLHNAFPRAVRQMAPAPAFDATTQLGTFFGLMAGN
jgi:hypothetical protein